MSWTLVTGGAKGLGAEICRHLAQKGYNVLVHYNQSEIEALGVVDCCRKLGVKAHAVRGSFSSRESVEQFILELKSAYTEIQHLINNVGEYFIGSPLSTPLSEWEALFQVNVYTPLALIYGLLPTIIKLQGNIVNIGVAGLEKMRADDHYTAYTMTKMDLLMLTRAFAKELAPSFVRVNMVSPGYLENSVDLPSETSKFPMKRPAYFQEVARVVAFLLDQESNYITGQNIEVAGGIRL
jgi:NAD(P)-dependent dehydrogenase (short-subunit alcohol dehydrogenase family)